MVAAATKLTGPSGDYNCFGLVFASRRTNLNTPGAPADIDLVLRRDGYTRVDTPQVGDVAVYRANDGAETEHVGFAAACESVGTVPVVKVWSMWGGLGEFVHTATQTPYSDTNLEWWRLGR